MSTEGDEGQQALNALEEIGRQRHQLDQAELVAVRTARRHQKSWAEIAVQLGVSRQSAWERWRDLDEDRGTASAASTPSPMDEPADPATEMIERATSQLRRRASVIVPNVIGLPWEDANQVLQSKGLVGLAPSAEEMTRGVDTRLAVIDQSPESGAKVPPGSTITLWIEHGGGSAGVREPRRPTPTPRAARERHYEPTDQAAS